MEVLTGKVFRGQFENIHLSSNIAYPMTQQFNLYKGTMHVHQGIHTKIFAK